MRISVIGCGYLGAVHAACLASVGHDVVGYDVDAGKVARLSTGDCPFFEPGLPELLGEQLASGRLTFTSDPAALHGAEVHFICVGTPQSADEAAADLRYVEAAVADLLPQLRRDDVVVGKSTVPVGTAAGIARTLERAGTGATLVWNPEFLREGTAIKDSLAPDRLVYGLPGGEPGELARKRLDEVYESIIATGCPVVIADYPTAELVKVAANSFLATKISFINAMARVCDAAGADVVRLADAIGLDPRVGPSFLRAGLGFGGGCLPKDIRAFRARAGELGVDEDLAFLREIDLVNQRLRIRMVELARELCGGSLSGLRVAVLGAAFKPHSDDVRDSPALEVAELAMLEGANVVVTDPEAVGNAAASRPALSYTLSTEAALTDADLVFVLTEWPEYIDLDPATVRDIVAVPRIVDGRHCLDPDVWRSAGWTYRALGRT